MLNFHDFHIRFLIGFYLGFLNVFPIYPDCGYIQRKKRKLHGFYEVIYFFIICHKGDLGSTRKVLLIHKNRHDVFLVIFFLVTGIKYHFFTGAFSISIRTGSLS